MTAGEIAQTLTVVGEPGENKGERVAVAGGCGLERGREFVDGQVATLSLVVIDNTNNSSYMCRKTVATILGCKFWSSS